jgi:hypothetical protein
MPERKPGDRRSLGIEDFELFGVNLRKVFPLPDDERFEELLRTIEELERRAKK